jgi:hypothetical protein
MGYDHHPRPARYPDRVRGHSLSSNDEWQGFDSRSSVERLPDPFAGDRGVGVAVQLSDQFTTTDVAGRVAGSNTLRGGWAWGPAVSSIPRDDDDV